VCSTIATKQLKLAHRERQDLPGGANQPLSRCDLEIVDADRLRGIAALGHSRSRLARIGVRRVKKL
jgi:hypothetical protein